MTMCSEQYMRILGCFPKYSNRDRYCVKTACELAGFSLPEYFRDTPEDKLVCIWENFNGRVFRKNIEGLDISICELIYCFECFHGFSKYDADIRFFSNILRWIDIHTEEEKLKNIRYVSACELFLAIFS